MRHLIASACLLLLAACAAEPVAVVASASPAASTPVAAAPAEAAASGPKMICHREEVTGSHFSHSVCEPDYQDNSAAKEAARALADQNTRVNPSAVKTTGH